MCFFIVFSNETFIFAIVLLVSLDTDLIMESIECLVTLSHSPRVASEIIRPAFECFCLFDREAFRNFNITASPIIDSMDLRITVSRERNKGFCFRF